MALANAMAASYTAHALDFPSADAAGLTTALGDAPLQPTSANTAGIAPTARTILRTDILGMVFFS